MIPPAAPPVQASTPAPQAAPENQLQNFEDKLAMDLGETLVPEEPTAPSTAQTDNSLASEMDELLSEITAGNKPTK
jgi:hypothetical protein